MKKLIQQVEEESGAVYQLYGDLERCYHPNDYHTLVFTSRWTGAKNPELEQVKGKLLLSPEGLANLRDLLAGSVDLEALNVYNEERLVSKYDKQNLKGVE